MSVKSYTKEEFDLLKKQTIKNLKKNKIMNIIIAILLSIGIVCLIGTGISKHERNECMKWQGQALEYPDFYMPEWAQAQCKHYQIKIK